MTIAVETVAKGSLAYPQAVKRSLGEESPAIIWVMGDASLLRDRTLALFSSVRCPGEVILRTYDFVTSLRSRDLTVIGGFHSPMEKECVKILLRGTARIIACPARSIENMRIPSEWRKPIEQRRMLVMSPFPRNYRRSKTSLAMQRNRFVAALADEVLIAHASSNSKTFDFARQVVAWGKPLLTFESEKNAALISLGAKPIA